MPNLAILFLQRRFSAIKIQQYFVLMKSANLKPMFYFVLLALFLIGKNAMTQTNEILVSLPWAGDQQEAFSFGQQVQLPALPFEFDSRGMAVFVFKQYEKGASKFNIELIPSNIQFSDASRFDNEYVQNMNFEIAEELQFEYRVATDRGKEFIAIEIEPYVKKNGDLKRVNSVAFSVTSMPNPISAMPLKFITNSAMASGQWYKIAIPSSGVYRIDHAFLNSNGIPTSGLNPNHIHVFGNGRGMLPENNGVERPDDLVNTPISVIGDGDGSFDAGDYILFYANGPDEIRFTGVRLTHIKNIYSTMSHYFICIDPSKTANRIQNAELSGAAPTHTITGTDQILFHEKDERKFENTPSGKRWFGELFDFVLQHAFNFNLVGLQTNEPVEIRTVYAQTGSGGGNVFRFFLNNASNPSHEINVGTGATWTSTTFNQTLASANLSVLLRLDRTNPSVKVYLDKIEINYRRNLNYSGGQYIIRDKNAIGQVSSVSLSGASSALKIWEVTTSNEAKNVPYSLDGNQANFRFSSESLRQFVAFTDGAALTPVFLKKVPNQNLHALPAADYLIVSHRDFLTQADRLADLHRADGWVVHVADVEQVYNEFSSGMQDPVAIRWFAKMFYDRANQTGIAPPLNLAIFGDGSYDPLEGRSPGNNNMVVTYQTDNSESYTASLTSDGFFVLFDNNEGFHPADGMDMGVGRLIATTGAHAKLLVDKVEHYKKYGSNLFDAQTLGCQTSSEVNRGDWQLVVTHIADDEDTGQFVRDHEGYINGVTHINNPNFDYDGYAVLHPEYNSEKVYIDAYPQISTPGGQRYPSVPPIINSRVERGSLIMNYVGHGGETGLALERIVTIPQIESWTNIDKMMLFVSATCEFTRFDDFSRESAGEIMYLSPKGAAVAMMTTTRLVFISVNSLVGQRFYEHVFLRDDNDRPITLGEVVQGTINTSNSSGGDANRRAFMLLGDPMLRLAMPNVAYEIVIDSINGLNPALVQDTMKSLSKVRVFGHLEDAQGNVLNAVNGFVVPTIFDKPKENQTLGQDPSSPVINFETQRNVVFRGKSTVTNGAFNFEFVVPKNIDYSFGNGKMSLFFYNNSTDAAAAETRFKVGGVDPNGISDVEGPDIEMYLNESSFVSGGITNESPIFFAKLFDENGVNAVGNGIGNDITLVLNGNTSQPIVLNDYYEADLDTYQSGVVRFQMPKLEPGTYTLTFKVWDVNNNSSEAALDFVVVASDDIDLNNVLNYPNPFTTHTEFYFEHNQPGRDLEVQIQVFTISGRLVKTINQSMSSCGFRTPGIPWDGRDDFGDQLARGTYIYRLAVNTPEGEKAEKFEKLVLLR